MMSTLKTGKSANITKNTADNSHRKSSSDYIRQSFDNKRKRGEFIGAFAPYGYKKDPISKNLLIIDDEAAKTVKDIFKWFVYEGCSKTGIAKKLNELAILNPAAYKKSKGLKYQNPQSRKNDGMWSYGTIKSILSNKIYTGCMVQGRYRTKSNDANVQVYVPADDWFIVPGTHEAIIDEQTFEKARSLNLRDMRTPPAKREVYLFSGFMRCADCKKAMTRKASKKNVYYSCRTYRDKSKVKCTKHNIRLDSLEQSVVAAIRKQIELSGGLSQIIDEIILTSKCYDTPEICPENQSPLPKNFIGDGNIIKLERGILVELIDTIYVHEGGGITIEFNFEDQYLSAIENKN